MMKCNKCGAENKGSDGRCEFCGYPLGKEYNPLKINYFSVMAGISVAVVLYTIFYEYYGEIGALSSAFSVFMGGLVTAVVDYDKAVKLSVYDNNWLVNGGISTFIIGMLFVLTRMVVAEHGSGEFIYLSGYLMFGVFGAAIGALINILRQKSTKWKIVIPIVAVIVLIISGFFIYNAYYDHRYYYDLGFQNDELGFSDALDNETSLLLDNSPVYAVNNETILKEIKLRYQRMANLTARAKRGQNTISFATSDVEKDYAITIESYAKLKNEYYLEMEMVTDLTIDGDIQGAKEHYNRAQKLLPQIQNLKETLEQIKNQDLQFKKQITEEELRSKNFVVRHKNDWMNPEF